MTIRSSGREAAYSTSSKAMLFTYWNIGKRIVEQELGGSERAEYGRGLVSALAEDLTKEFGKNYSKRNIIFFDTSLFGKRYLFCCYLSHDIFCKISCIIRNAGIFQDKLVKSQKY